jgi:1-acyl-sn-glycerol-3-phosphate acyltransferase
MMTNLFLHIYDFLAKRRWLTVSLFIALTALFAFLATRVRYEEDIAKFLPNGEENRKYQEVYQQFAAQSRIVVVFSAAEGDSLDTEAAEEAMQRFGEILEASDMAENVSVTMDETQVFDLMDAVYAHLPYFLEEADYQRIDSLIQTPGFVKERLSADKQMLMFPTSGVFMRTLPSDPLQLFTPALQRLNSLKLNDSFQVIDGYLFTADGQHGIVTFDSPYGANESYNNGKLSKWLDEKAAEVSSEIPGVAIASVGGPLIAATNAAQIKRDSITAVAIAIVLILLILLLHYRRLSDILWVGASILFGALFSLAGIAVFRGGISLIVVGIGSVLIGIVANYPLHFLDIYKETGDRREALREMVLPLFIGNLTTVAAFLCLLWLDARAMQDLGLFASLMLLGTILFVLIFLPQLMRRRPSPSENFLFGKWTGFHLSRSKARPWILGIGLIITVILGYFSKKTSFDSDLSHINYMTPSQRENLEILSQVQSSGTMYAVAEGKTLQEAVNRNDSLVQKLLGCKAVTSVSGVGEMLPSQQHQQEAADRWNSFWGDTKWFHLCEEVRREAAAQGFSDDAFLPFFRMFEERAQVADIEEFNDIVDPFTDKYIYQTENGWRIVNYVTADDQDAVHALIDDGDDAAFVFSGGDLGRQLVEMLRGSFNYIGIVCSLVVFVFLLFSFRKIELAILAFLPLAVSWIWILGVMYLAGIQFNIINIILATFIFGQGDDYTIFITEGLLYEYKTGKPRLASYKHSVVISALIMFAGIGCLVVAKHPALQSLALVTIVGMATVVLMASFLPTVIFDWLTKKRNGELRETPVTIKELFYTPIAGIIFLLVFLWVIPYTLIYFAFGKTTEAKKLKYHTVLCKYANFILRHIPGVRFNVDKMPSDVFDKPAVIIANHESFLDLLSMLSLTPKLVFITGDWVWRDPFYRTVVRHAEYYPAGDGMEANLPRLHDLMARGYSVCIFPEGTRSLNHEIQRFHKGAFTIARELSADILPILIRGAGYISPKGDLIFRSGTIMMTFADRCRPYEEINAESDIECDRLVAKQMRQFYRDWSSRITMD